MKPPLPSSLARMEHRAERLVEAIRVLEGPDGVLAHEIARQLGPVREAWQRIATNRGMDLPAIAFVGERNAGKTYLASRLVLHPGVNDWLQPGEAEVGKTERLLWIGPEAPDDLDPSRERHWRLESAEMVDLGVPYVLLDTPGFDDLSPELNERATRALESVRIKVVVVDSARYGAEAWAEAMVLADGSWLIPAIHLSPRETLLLSTEEPAMLADFRRQTEKMALRWPHSVVLDPVLLPDVDTAGAGGREWLEGQVRERLATALRGLLRARPDLRAGAGAELEAAWERWTGELSEALARHSLDPGPLRERYLRLLKTLETLPRKVVEHLLADGPQLRALLRNRLRIAYMEALPGGLFPFRSVAGVLCWTTGAWDRVLLGLGGSLPSMAMAGWKAVREVRQVSEAQAALGLALRVEVHEVVTAEVLGPLREFRSALERLRGSREERSPGEVDFDLHGAEPLALRWEQSLGSVAQERRMATGWGIVAGVLATAIFWFLLGGPLLYVYGQYLPAAWDSWRGEFSDYPAVGWQLWTLALLLALVPVFLLALLSVGAALSGRRVALCERELRARWLKEAADGTLGLAVTLREPRLAALRTLLDELPPSAGHSAGPRTPDV